MPARLYLGAIGAFTYPRRCRGIGQCPCRLGFILEPGALAVTQREKNWRDGLLTESEKLYPSHEKSRKRRHGWIHWSRRKIGWGCRKGLQGLFRNCWKNYCRLMHARGLRAETKSGKSGLTQIMPPNAVSLELETPSISPQSDTSGLEAQAQAAMALSGTFVNCPTISRIRLPLIVSVSMSSSTIASRASLWSLTILSATMYCSSVISLMALSMAAALSSEYCGPIKPPSSMASVPTEDMPNCVTMPRAILSICCRSPMAPLVTCSLPKMTCSAALPPKAPAIRALKVLRDTRDWSSFGVNQVSPLAWPRGKTVNLFTGSWCGRRVPTSAWPASW